MAFKVNRNVNGHAIMALHEGGVFVKQTGRLMASEELFKLKMTMFYNFYDWYK
jgi:hypothetical protein